MSPQYTPDEIERMVATARHTGAVSKNLPVCWRAFEQIAGIIPSARVLDYGSGQKRKQTKLMQERYPIHTFQAHDLSLGTTLAHSTDYFHVTVASNVLNVQPSEYQIKAVLHELSRVTQPGGLMIVNYPTSPRHAGLATMDLVHLLRNWTNYTNDVRQVGIPTVYVARNSK